MDVFTLEIAGVAFAVHSLFQSTIEYCKPYLTHKLPMYEISVSREDLLFQQKLLDIEADEEGLKRRIFKDPFLERTTIQRRIADHLILHNTLMIHGSTVAVDGVAYMFTAPCGTGKSTHTRLWREVFGDRAVMVNDDKPFLQITEQGVFAYGSPWSGKHGLASNICAPLKGICLLHRGAENQISPMDAEKILPILSHQAHVPLDNHLSECTYGLIHSLAQRVSLWEMSCNKDPEAAMVSYGAMSALRL